MLIEKPIWGREPHEDESVDRDEEITTTKLNLMSDYAESLAFERFRDAGVWAGDVNYLKSDIVTVDGISWQAIAPSINIEPGTDPTKWKSFGATTPDNASDSVRGIVKLTVAPVSPTNPLAVGDNDPRLPDATTRAIPIAVTQAAHGLSVGNWIRLSGSGTYAKAQANSLTNSQVIGRVLTVPTSGTFTYIQGGYITGLSSLTAGSVYYLSPTSAGDMTITEPITNGQVSKPIFITDSTTSGYITIKRGNLIGIASTQVTDFATAVDARFDGRLKIGEVTLATDAASITFSAIPATWKHLELKGMLRGNIASGNTTIEFRLNGDTGNNYRWRVGYFETTPVVDFATGVDCGYGGYLTGNTLPSGEFTDFEMRINNYASTIFRKMVRTTSAHTVNTSPMFGFETSFWNSTAAITSITVFPHANSFLAGSTISLYGYI